MYELGKDKPVDFHFLNGATKAESFPGISDHFEGPFYRFYDEDAPNVAALPPWMFNLSSQDMTPEDFMRRLRHECIPVINPSSALDSIQRYVEDQTEPFEILLGYSEGASVAASLLLHQASTLCAKPFQGAIFICGSPPYDGARHESVLADEDGRRINVPTAHVVGSADPTRLAGLALYNICSDVSASIVDHGKGHAIPWDRTSTKAMAQAVRGVLNHVSDCLRRTP